MSFATEDFKEKIRDKHLRPAFERDVTEFTHTRFYTRRWGDRAEMAAKIMTALAMGSVSVGLWNEDASRACMLTSLLLKAGNLTLLAIANVLKKRASKSTERLNATLHTIGLDTVMPNANEDVSQESTPPVIHE